MSSSAIAAALRQGFEEAVPVVRATCEELANWLHDHHYEGYEPNDLATAPAFRKSIFRKPLFCSLITYFGEHSGKRTRRFFKVPISYTPTTLALSLAACSELYFFDPTILPTIVVLRDELLRLRIPGERECCWGDQYDENSDGLNVPAFKPDSYVSYLCGTAMLNLAEKVHDNSAIDIAESVGRYFITRLNRSVDEPEELCFSTSPNDEERIFHKNSLVGSYLARLWSINGNDEYLELAERCMKFLRNAQLATGMWYYGLGKKQRGINAVQTSYNAIALNDYRRYTGDSSFEDTFFNGNEAYKRVFFETNGKPKMFLDRLYPVDIRACSQAIAHFAVMIRDDSDAPDRAINVLQWTMKNMSNPDGSFAYRKYATGRQDMAYAAWSQAHMFNAMARLRSALAD